MTLGTYIPWELWYYCIVGSCRIFSIFSINSMTLAIITILITSKFTVAITITMITTIIAIFVFMLVMIFSSITIMIQVIY